MSARTTSPVIVAGQRWMSEAEPELGLGTVVAVDVRTVIIEFAAADETRRYAMGSAPLRRVRFAAGELVADNSGETLRIDRIIDESGLLTYVCGQRHLPEHLLGDRLALSTPRERLIAGRVDPPELFDLRLETLRRLGEIRRSAVRGFVGPRLELLPHQFYIASEVTSRYAPRVLLADETGLGKTIEACLTLNRLLLSGRAARMLILVPDSLVHQWLVELRRRFNLRFSVFDEQRCQAIEESEDEANPFLSEQLVLAGLTLLAGSQDRSAQAAAAGWDVVVVDEAHHLVWSQDQPSPEYCAVETVAKASAGLMLLTATPEQLGEQSHFARLRLLDPDRYSDFDAWRTQARGYREVALIGQSLLAEHALEEAAITQLAAILGSTPAQIGEQLQHASGRRHLIEQLVDRHGPGRVMFRNTRAAAIAEFPERRVELRPLETSDTEVQGKIGREVSIDLGRQPVQSAIELGGDPRISRLLEILADRSIDKLLVICSSADKAQAVKSAIDSRMKVDIALFHEELSLLQRDRNAAWFADPSGARVLLCSEIGSEGRNFQHAHHLLMFDLPLDPDLIEQRIGRLDRIGQRSCVNIEVPYTTATGQEVLARWHHHGVDAFARPTLIARPLLERFGERVSNLASSPDVEERPATAQLEELIADTAASCQLLAEKVEQGRDLLLEMTSLRHEVANSLISKITALGDDRKLEEFFLRLLEHFRIYAEEIAPRCYLLNPDAMGNSEFPSLERGETAVTFSRNTALVREDLDFITQDHPLLGDAMELLLASESGNASFAVAGDSGGPPRVELESIFVLEAVAPSRLHLDRFLAPTPLHIVTDQNLDDLSDRDNHDCGPLSPGHAAWIKRNQAVVRKLIGTMTARSEELAKIRAEAVRAQAIETLRDSLGSEVERLSALAELNDQIRPQEIAATKSELEQLEGYINDARLRIDASRLIWHGPSSNGTPKL